MKKQYLVLAFILILSISLVFVGCSSKQAAKKFPSQPLTLIVNYGGGGSTDLSARAIGQAAEKILGQPITIVNKAGASGTTGIIELQNSKNEGYFLGTTTFSPLAIVPHTQQVPYTPEDFEYILGYGQYLYGIAVKGDSPYKTVKDLVADAKKKAISYSSSGFPNILAMIALEKADGVKFTYVPYASGAEAATALLGGHVQAVVQNVSDIESFLKTGEMRLIASCSAKRWDIAPEISTLKEQGYNIDITSWLGLGVPKGIPAENLKILREAFKKASEDPAYIEIMKRIGLPPVYLDGDAYKKFVIEGSVEIGKVIKEMGLGK